MHTLHAHRQHSRTQLAMQRLLNTMGPAAYLLYLQALDQRHSCYLNQSKYIPGPVNAMANDASQLWHLTDDAFLAHITLTYLKSKPWHLFHLQPKEHLALNMALQCKHSEPAQFRHAPDEKTKPGICGATIVKSWESIP